MPNAVPELPGARPQSTYMPRERPTLPPLDKRQSASSATHQTSKRVAMAAALLPSDVARSEAFDTLPPEPKPPSIELAKQRALEKLPTHPVTGKRYTARTSIQAGAKAFQPLGLNAFTYISLLEMWKYFYMVILLLNVSSMTQNAYGHMLDDKQISLQTYLFTFTSLGNSASIDPAYGANELATTCCLVAFLYWSVWKLRVISRLLVRALQQRAQLSPRRLRRRVRQRRAQPSEAARVAGNPFVPGRHLRSIRAAAPRFKASDPQRQADRPQPSARILGARL